MTVPAPDYRDPRLTEQRNPRTQRIDVASSLEIVDLINAEDSTVAPAVHAVRQDLARAIDLGVDAFRRGRRLVHLGAGTAGRPGGLGATGRSAGPRAWCRAPIRPRCCGRPATCSSSPRSAARRSRAPPA